MRIIFPKHLSCCINSKLGDFKLIKIYCIFHNFHDKFPTFSFASGLARMLQANINKHNLCIHPALFPLPYFLITRHRVKACSYLLNDSGAYATTVTQSLMASLIEKVRSSFPQQKSKGTEGQGTQSEWILSGIKRSLSLLTFSFQ